MKLEKVYKVTFMTYTNVMKDTVSDWDGKPSNISKVKCLSVGKEPFLVRESDLDKYRCFGDGYRDIQFIGNMEVTDTKSGNVPIFGEVDINTVTVKPPYSTSTPITPTGTTISQDSPVKGTVTKVCE